LFDRPKPTAGCRANGREEEKEEVMAKDFLLHGFVTNYHLLQNAIPFTFYNWSLHLKQMFLALKIAPSLNL
jgi:hypothetical protein